MIPVTKPFLPAIEEYNHYVKKIWERTYLTNNGPLVQQLENELEEYLEVPNLLLLSNGTIALQIAIKALELSGEIITTPFSYVATTNSIIWEGCKPVFVDIDPKTLTLDPALIEDAITHKTSAILATHVFGNACDIDAIQLIADKYNLKVIYDAAHCFGTKYKGRSIFEYGDISTVSFHATKVFHSVEGGAVITNNTEIAERIKYLRNFGHSGPDNFILAGINGKNSEFHAAMGLCNLKYIDKVLGNRKKQSKFYQILLEGAPVQHLLIQNHTVWNYAYFPIIFENEQTMLKVKSELERNDIFTRRYFYPSLDTLDYVISESLEVSRDISKRILCLPLFDQLSLNEQRAITKIIIRTLFNTYEKDINAWSQPFSSSGN